MSEQPRPGRPERGPVLSLPLPALVFKLPFVRLHIYFPPAEAHALGFQPKSLLDRGIPAQLDFSSCA